MSEEKFSRTVRIDLMPGGDVSAPSPLLSNDLLAKSNWSTRRRQAAVAAATTHSRYEELLESVYDAAVITAPSGKIIEVNGRAVEFLGYDREQMCQMSMVNVIDGADDSVMRNIADTLLNERFALLQAFCLRNDGSSFPAEIAVNRLSTDNVRLCFFIRDVSVRHQAEEMLRTEHTAMQTCGSGIAITDNRGILYYVNPAFAALLEQEAEDFPEKDIREVLRNPELISSLIDSALGSEETWMSEFPLDGGSGDPLYIQVSATCSRGTDGTARGVVFSFADITLHKKAEEDAETARAEMEARVQARTADLLLINERLQERIDELETVLATVSEVENE